MVEPFLFVIATDKSEQMYTIHWMYSTEDDHCLSDKNWAFIFVEMRKMRSRCDKMNCGDVTSLWWQPGKAAILSCVYLGQCGLKSYDICLWAVLCIGWSSRGKQTTNHISYNQLERQAWGRVLYKYYKQMGWGLVRSHDPSYYTQYGQWGKQIHAGRSLTTRDSQSTFPISLTSCHSFLHSLLYANNTEWRSTVASMTSYSTPFTQDTILCVLYLFHHNFPSLLQL